MEKFPRIEQKSDSENRTGESEKESLKSPHREAVEFVEKYRDFFEHYARGRVNFEPAPAGLDTFAFDFKTDKIFLNSRFYKDRGFSEEKTSFATLHEIEHFLEKKEMLGEESGDKKFKRYLKQIKESEAYSLMDNCVADVRENRAVVQKTTRDFRNIETGLYKEDLFPELDFTERPKHIQFCEAILREARVPDEKCVVSPEVRKKLDALKNVKTESAQDFLSLLTNSDVPMSLRVALQNEHIWPIVKGLLEKDIKDKRGGKKEKEKGKSGKSKGAKKKKKGEKEKKESGEKTAKDEGEPTGEKDPNKIFKDDYEKAKKRAPHAASIEEIEKAFEKWQETKKENPFEKADNEYAERLGVKKEDLQRYRNIVKNLEKIRNPETSVSVIQELRELIAKIIAKRMKPAPAPRYPVEEGEELVDPAELVSQFQVGNLEPKVWETYEIKEKKGKKFGEVEITLVCDRSGSMEGAKLVEQQKAAVLMMEALKEFADACYEEKINMAHPLEVRSEIYSFQATDKDAKPLKIMSKELGEKERIEITAVLSSAPGESTTDFIPLEKIEAGLDENLKRKITEGEVKKIVIIFTDGASDHVQRVKNILEKLRKDGVIAVGVGITEEGKVALDTYAPDARLAETAEKLPLVLGELLKEHLTDI